MTLERDDIRAAVLQVVGTARERSLDEAMTDDVIVLCWHTPTRSETNALRIAEFSGANVRSISVGASASHVSLRELVPACICLIVHVETLVRLADTIGGAADGLLVLAELAEHIFVFGFQATDQHLLILETLSSHSLVSVKTTPAGDDQFHVMDDQREWCAQFSGLSFGAVNANWDKPFRQGAEEPQSTALIRAGDDAFVVRIRYGSSEVFLSACTELANLDETLGSDASALSWFSRLVPLMMFLRGALRERLWHSDTPRACFIVDDPLLRNRYGFLEYRKLSEAMEGQKFALCVAFIPWNFRRSPGQVRDLFLGEPRKYAVCIHGCDHTAAEFQSTDFESLAAKAALAVDRMEAHQKQTGIPFDKVMVFPQGLFSAEGLNALHACAYLAAVNTHLCPSNTNGILALRDLLDVAMTRFDCPMFGRRYPDDGIARFALDLFLGKPALAVEHHQYFRRGYGALRAFVSELNAADGRLEWNDLTTVCSRAHLTRRTESGDVHVRFYTNRFFFQNTGKERNRYVLFRKWTAPAAAVTLNGERWACELAADELRLIVTLDVGQGAAVEIEPIAATRVAVSANTSSRFQAVHVMSRRLMCEIRDNYVDTNPLLNSIASSLRHLKSTVGALIRHIPLPKPE